MPLVPAPPVKKKPLLAPAGVTLVSYDNSGRTTSAIDSSSCRVNAAISVSYPYNHAISGSQVIVMKWLQEEGRAINRIGVWCSAAFPLPHRFPSRFRLRRRTLHQWLRRYRSRAIGTSDCCGVANTQTIGIGHFNAV